MNSLMKSLIVMFVLFLEIRFIIMEGIPEEKHLKILEDLTPHFSSIVRKKILHYE